MNGYERFCFNLLGRDLKARRGEYIDLRNDLTGARMNTPFEAYLATAYVSSIAVATDEDLRSCIVTLRSPTKRIRMEEKGSDATSRSPLKDAIEASCQAAGKAIEFCGRQD